MIGARAVDLGHAGAMIRPRVLFVVNHAGFFLSHRLPLAVAAREAGYEVHVATPESKHVKRIIDEGFTWHRVNLRRSNVNVLGELSTLLSLIRLYRTLKPDLVHHVTMKPVIYGTLAARVARIPAVVNAVSGMGYAFVGGGRRWLSFVIGMALSIALRHPNLRVIFQNEAQREMFSTKRWVRAEHTVLIRGSGVDLTFFRPHARSSAETPVVLFASRMIKPKGVREFIEAARELLERGANARFVLAGEPDPDNPDSVTEDAIRRWIDGTTIEYLGRLKDMRPIFAEAGIVCLPTYYPEGVPKVLLEAAASGVAIVASDVPGCREAVEPEVTGILVPPRDQHSLVEAISALLGDPERVGRLGRAGRRKAEEEFDVREVQRRTLAVYHELLGKPHPD